MLDFLSPAFIQHLIETYGLWVLFVIVMGESMGVPLPGETALIGVSLYAGSTHAIAITTVILVAAAAAVVGDNLGYLVGRSLGLRALTRYGHHVGLHEARLNIGRYLFLRHGGKIVFVGRFIAFLRTFAAALAGANRMPWAAFLLMNALGGLCWAGLMGMAAYLFGQQIESVTGPAGIALLVLGAAAMIGAFLFFRRHEGELQERAERSLAQPRPRRRGRGREKDFGARGGAG